MVARKSGDGTNGYQLHFEAKVNAMAEEFAALRRELDDAKKAGSADNWQSLRADADTAHQVEM